MIFKVIVITVMCSLSSFLYSSENPFEGPFYSVTLSSNTPSPRTDTINLLKNSLIDANKKTIFRNVCWTGTLVLGFDLLTVGLSSDNTPMICTATLLCITGTMGTLANIFKSQSDTNKNTALCERLASDFDIENQNNNN